jgi:hypothetical protein
VPHSVETCKSSGINFETKNIIIFISYLSSTKMKWQLAFFFVLALFVTNLMAMPEPTPDARPDAGIIARNRTRPEDRPEDRDGDSRLTNIIQQILGSRMSLL